MAHILHFESRDERDAWLRGELPHTYLAETVIVRGGYEVLPHVQAFADAVEEHGWATSFGTYAGHDPTPERALDIFVPVDDPAPARSICQFGISNQPYFGIWYEMSRQHIWNIERASEGWRPQSPYDRGGVTANHYDHVHVSFYEETSSPIPPPEEDWLSALNEDQQKEVLNGIIFLGQFVNDDLKPAITKGGDGNYGKGLERLVKLLKNADKEG